MLAVAPLGFAGAVRDGVGADRMGTAFLAGYRSALRALVPSLGSAARPALAATEDGPLHPRDVRTTLVPAAHGWSLTGRKRFVTGLDADVLVVLARVPDGRLATAIVQVTAAGVTLTAMPALGFVPEVGHAEVDLRDVALPADGCLPGDGWAEVVRPFRTVEDVHVVGAITGYAAGAAVRLGWPREELTGLLSSLAALAALAAAPPDAPATHLALAATLDAARARLGAVPWTRDVGDRGDDPGEAARWRRDLGLLRVADRARAARTDAAWARLVTR